jgi:glycosyltransferase involved in cell wall biosynthesis
LRICHITPHLPPDQAANALLPYHLGRWARQRGDDVTYISQAVPDGSAAALPGPVVRIPSPRSAGSLARWTRAASLRTVLSLVTRGGGAIRAADIVHAHSNGLLSEAGTWLAHRRGTPVVLTLYGTEIWHYRPRRTLDLFTRAYFAAVHVTFYSERLRQRARELGLDRPETSVIYPPVVDEFHPLDEPARRAARRALGIAEAHLLVNVKRLHPLGGQRTLIEAMPSVVERLPDTRLLICGTGPLEAELRRSARDLGVDAHITFAGRVDNPAVARYDAAADLFVLPSLLEACPTVALEALACGTRVVSTDNPGGLELHERFGDDVAIVPRERPAALADAIVAALTAAVRTTPRTAEMIAREVRPPAVNARYLAIYTAVAGVRG